MDVVQRRNALAEALSAHNTAAVKSFLHPSFAIRGTDGTIVMDQDQLVHQLPEFFSSHPEYKQTASPELRAVEGDTAILTTQRAEILRVLWTARHISSRWEETWKRIGGEWFLLQERPI